MKLLALDTATEACSVALLTPSGLVETYRELERGHGQEILPMVDALLRQAGLGLSDLDAIAVGRGPGGFTGLRLGISVAQGLALGASKPVVGVSNLAAVALDAFDRHPDVARVLVCNDARMKEVYTALFQRGDDGLALLVGKERVCPPSSVVAPGAVGKLVGAGRGFRAYPDLADRLSGGLVAIDASLLPRASSIARLAGAAFRRGEAVAPEALLPVYLRDDVARPAAVR